MKNTFTYCITINSSKCTGCQACVMACSFHKQQVFSVTGSCIKIFKQNDSGEISISINRSCCDMCSNEKFPLCIQFCTAEAISITRKIMVKENNGRIKE